MKEKKPRIVDNILMSITDFMAKIPDFSRRNRSKILTVFVFMTIVLGYGLTMMKMDQSMESFFLDDDSTLHEYKKFRYIFGSDETIVIMYEPKNGDIFSSESINAVRNLEKELNDKKDSDTPLGRIKRVRSIVSADYLESKGDLLLNRKFIGEKTPQTKEEIETLRTLALNHKDYPGSFFSKDSKIGMLIIETDYGTRRVESKKVESNNVKKENTSDDDFDFSDDSSTSKGDSTDIYENIPEMEKPEMSGYSEFIIALEDVLKSHKWSNPSMKEKPSEVMNYTMAGNPWMMHFFMKIIMEQMGIVSLFSLLIIFSILYLAFRSFSATLWPTLIVMLSNVWTLGFMSLIGVTMSMMVNIVMFLVYCYR